MSPDSFALTEQLLLRLARVTLSDGDHQLIERLAPRVDWKLLARLACRGGIGGLVVTHLGDVDAPVDIRRTLAAVSLRTEATNRRLVGLAQQLCSAAEAEGLTIIPLKGSALNLVGPYRDLGLRSQCDVDLLARPDQLDAATRLFQSLGCRPIGDREYARRHQHHFKFAYGGGADRILVELHWTAFHVRYQRPGYDVAVLLRSSCAAVRGATIRLLDPLDTLLSVALHLAVHRYREQLKWLVDVAELGRSFAPLLDWSQLWCRARELGATRAVGYAFVLARDLLQAPLQLPPGSRQLLQLAGRLSPAGGIVASQPQPSWGLRAAVDLLGHDTPFGGLRSLTRKGRELLYRRRTQGVWSKR